MSDRVFCAGCKTLHPDGWILGGECMAEDGWRGFPLDYHHHGIHMDHTGAQEAETIDAAWLAMVAEDVWEERDNRAFNAGLSLDYVAHPWATPAAIRQDDANNSRRGHYEHGAA